jgi:hypothetical protein
MNLPIYRLLNCCCWTAEAMPVSTTISAQGDTSLCARCTKAFREEVQPMVCEGGCGEWSQTVCWSQCWGI